MPPTACPVERHWYRTVHSRHSRPRRPVAARDRGDAARRRRSGKIAARASPAARSSSPSLTAFSRVLGLLRTVVFSQTVGAGCLGTAYVTANQVPNLIVELAIGGALASAMVPVLARAANRAAADPEAKAHVEQVSSALMTWSVLILLPVTVAIALAARPDRRAAEPGQPERRLLARRHDQRDHVHAGLVRAADPALRHLGGAVRAAAGVPEIRRGQPGPGDRQRGDDHRLLGLRVARPQRAAGAVRRWAPTWCCPSAPR